MSEPLEFLRAWVEAHPACLTVSLAMPGHVPPPKPATVLPGPAVHREVRYSGGPVQGDLFTKGRAA